MEITKHIDVALIHGYWPSQKGDDGEYSQGLRGRLATRAAAIEFHSGKVDTLVITNGQVWGDKYPPVADLMKHDLIELYHVPEKNIFAKGTAVSSQAEIEDGLKIVNRYPLIFKTLESTAFRTHHLTIPLLFQNIDYGNHQVVYRSVEDILMQDKNPANNESRQQLEWLLESKYERNFQVYEKIQKLLIESSAATLLHKAAKNTRREKGKGGLALSHFPIDVFDV